MGFTPGTQPGPAKWHYDMGFHEDLSHGSLQAVCTSTAKSHESRYQVCIILNAALSLMKHIISCRPMGWHGKSGAAHFGSHITIDFLSSNTHVVTHHVYLTNATYQKKGWKAGRNGLYLYSQLFSRQTHILPSCSTNVPVACIYWALSFYGSYLASQLTSFYNLLAYNR